MGIFSDIDHSKEEAYNQEVSHPLQSFEWGEFRKKTGITVIRRAILNKNGLENPFTLTIHKIPHTKFTIGYLPKGNFPDMDLIKEIERIGKENNCIFIQLEPNIKKGDRKFKMENLTLNSDPIGANSKLPILNSFHPLFTKYTFILDLTKSEDEILKNMHHKTRYNIRLSEKKGVVVKEDNSEKAFKKYLTLTEETTKRQRFFAHTLSYHEKMWETLRSKSEKKLSLHLFTAKYNNETLVTWIVFVFHDTLYYPYGASSDKHRNLMASNLMMWETIKFGKKIGLKKFDMWGALSIDPDIKDAWYGFHKFKEGYNPKHVEFIGSFDLVINSKLYNLYKIADKSRWALLKIKTLF